MKKITAILLVCATALFCVPGLAACDDKNDSPDETPVAEYTVSESEWEEAISLKWKNLTYTADIQGDMGDENSDSSLTLQMLENGSIHQITDGTGWSEWYFIVNNDNTVSSYHHYTTTGDTWKCYPDDYTDLDAYNSGRYGDDVGYLSYIIPLCAADSSSYTYDEANHCYTRIMSVEEGILGPIPLDCPIEISFENKKLTKIIISGEAEGRAFTITLTFYDYGSTVITPPEHAFNIDEWEHDETEHWHPCIAEGCKDKAGQESHTYVNGKCKCGLEQSAA